MAGLGSHQRASSSSPRRRRADRDGHAGNRGYLFNFTAEFLDELRRRLPPRRFGFLVENVEMTPADAAEASKQLGCQPVFADAADFGWIGRPRLWWSSIDWDEVTHDPSTAERWTWVLRIIAAGIAYAWTPPRAAPDSFDLDGLKFFDAVASGRIRLPCSTTPAADERGRPPPRSMRGKVTTDVQFAPWHYQRDAMLADDQEKLVVLTPGPRSSCTTCRRASRRKRRKANWNPGPATASWATGGTGASLAACSWHSWCTPPRPCHRQRRYSGAIDIDASMGRRTMGAGRPAHGTSTGETDVGSAPGPRRGDALEGFLGVATRTGDAAAVGTGMGTPILELRRRWRHDLVRVRRRS